MIVGDTVVVLDQNNDFSFIDNDNFSSLSTTDTDNNKFRDNDMKISGVSLNYENNFYYYFFDMIDASSSE
jgi:hypothetical protein